MGGKEIVAGGVDDSLKTFKWKGSLEIGWELERAVGLIVGLFQERMFGGREKGTDKMNG